MIFNLAIPDCGEQEARNLANGSVSERIKSVARKALLAASTPSLTRYEDRTDGAIDVYHAGEFVGTARHYKRYWQIYNRITLTNIRRTALPALKIAIQEGLAK